MDLVKFGFFTTIISPLLVIQQQASAAPVCKDLNSKCSDYDARYCIYENVKQQCPLTCNQCGSIHPSSPVTSTTSLHLIEETQSTLVVSQSLTVTQSTVPISQVTPLPQSLAPTQGTVSVSPVPSQTPSSVVLSQGLLNSLPTQKTDVVRSSSVGLSGLSVSEVLTQTQSSVDLSQGLLKRPSTLNTDVAGSSSVGLNKIKTQTFVAASASKTKSTRANFLITLGILSSYLMYW